MSKEDNVYQTPTANLTSQEENNQNLAPRIRRLLAAIIDGIIGLCFSIPIFIFFGYWEQVQAGLQPPFRFTLAATIAGLLFFLLVHGHLLANRGQTVGKYILGIRIVKLDGALLDFGRLIGLRYAPIWIVTLIPVLGSILPLIDVLFIFRKDRRCVHDLIAGTKVINAA